MIWLSKKLTKNKMKFIFFVLAIFYSGVMVIRGTYAWVTYGDERINRSNSENLSLKIKVLGDLDPVVLSSQYKTEKKIQVKNANTSPAVVRISLEELLLSFEIDTMDQTGNGNIKNYFDSVSSGSIDYQKVESWKVNGYYRNVEQKVVYKGLQKASDFYLLNNDQKRDELLSWIQLNFSNVRTTLPNAAQSEKDYWLYQEESAGGKKIGYFYYSEVLYKNKASSILLDNISIKKLLPNRMKGSFYTVNINAEASIAVKETLTIWNKQQTSPVYKMLSKKLLDAEE